MLNNVKTKLMTATYSYYLFCSSPVYLCQCWRKGCQVSDVRFFFSSLLFMFSNKFITKSKPRMRVTLLLKMISILPVLHLGFSYLTWRKTLVWTAWHFLVGDKHYSREIQRNPPVCSVCWWLGLKALLCI